MEGRGRLEVKVKVEVGRGEVEKVPREAETKVEMTIEVNVER